MQYNIHPIFVHFPIAFLMLYSLIKILPLQRWISNISLKVIERILLTAGILGGLLALQTGEIAENLTNPNHDILEMHEFFASSSVRVYGLILLGELMVIFGSFVNAKIKNQMLLNIYGNLVTILTNKYLVITLAVVGVVAIALTGLLGGVMVYGTSADPLAEPVLSLLGINF